LYARIDARLDAMLAGGLVDEVRALVAQGYGWDLPAMSALGYSHIGQYLRGECSLDEAVTLIRRATRQFVRRQANWFRASDPAIRWFESSDQSPAQMATWLAQGRLDQSSGG
jgi:tRNA dimethylallyltransferase